MDATELQRHAQTYHRFSLGVKWFVVHSAAVAVFLTLWLATPAGFGWGLVGGIVVLALAIWAMRQGLAHSSEQEELPPSGRPEAHA
jgi:hypothetical protein